MQKLLGVLCIFLLGLFAALRISTANKVIIPKNREVKIVAEVKNEPKIRESGQVLEIGDVSVYTDLYPRFMVGDKLEIKGTADETGRMFGANVKKIGEAHTLANYFLRTRQRLSAKMGTLIPPPESTLLIGETLGVDNISRDFKDALVKTGTIHVVVVSGENLMIVAALIISLAKFIGRKQSLVLATIAVFAYAALCGFAPPVVRASLMVLAGTAGLFFGRNTLPIWNLAIAAAVILLFWPQALFEVSFQLTFAATFGIMTLGKFLANFWSRLPFLGENAAIAVSAYIFTAPIILFYFGKSSFISPIANILVVSFIGPIMVLGFLCAALALFFLPAAQIVANIVYIPAFVFVKIVEFFSKIPIGEFSMGQGNLYFAATFYLIILTVFFIWTRDKKYY